MPAPRLMAAWSRLISCVCPGFAAECGPLQHPVRGYLAGGLGVRCYTGTRVTGDIDMFFTGGRVLMAPNTTVLVSHQRGEHSLVFDHWYTPDFGLLHPDY